jgi:hypothetical protein
MNNDFTVIESRMETDGRARHLVQAPGGTVVIHEDEAGNLSARIRSGHTATDEDQKQTIQRAIDAVRELRQSGNSAQAGSELTSSLRRVDDCWRIVSHRIFSVTWIRSSDLTLRVFHRTGRSSIDQS